MKIKIFCPICPILFFYLVNCCLIAILSMNSASDNFLTRVGQIGQFSDKWDNLTTFFCRGF